MAETVRKNSEKEEESVDNERETEERGKEKSRKGGETDEQIRTHIQRELG